MIFEKQDSRYERAGKDPAEFESLLICLKRQRLNGCVLAVIGMIGFFCSSLMLLNASSPGNFGFWAFAFMFLAFGGFTAMNQADPQVRMLILLQSFLRSRNAKHGKANGATEELDNRPE